MALSGGRHYIRRSRGGATIFPMATSLISEPKIASPASMSQTGCFVPACSHSAQTLTGCEASISMYVGLLHTTHVLCIPTCLSRVPTIVYGLAITAEANVEPRCGADRGLPAYPHTAASSR